MGGVRGNFPGLSHTYINSVHGLLFTDMQAQGVMTQPGDDVALHTTLRFSCSPPLLTNAQTGRSCQAQCKRCSNPGP